MQTPEVKNAAVDQSTDAEPQQGGNPLEGLTLQEQTSVMQMNEELATELGYDMAHLLSVHQAITCCPPGQERTLFARILQPHLDWLAERLGFTQEQVDAAFLRQNQLTMKYFGHLMEKADAGEQATA